MTRKSLAELLHAFPAECLPANADQLFAGGLANDSRKVVPGDLFFAVPGTKVDGAAFLPEAQRRGAVAAVVPQSSGLSSCGLPLVAVADVRAALAFAAAAFFAHPAREMRAIGVTGTNGKTSVAWLLAWALDLLGERAALFGTLGWGIVQPNMEFLEDLGTTTPDALMLQRFLCKAKDGGAKAFTMEVSSHGISQARSRGIDFDCAVFTNLSRDHLDFHGTIEAYGETKQRLFTEDLAASMKKERCAVVNADDEWGKRILAGLPCGVQALSFSQQRGAKADITLLRADTKVGATSLAVSAPGGELTFNTRLIGEYNVENTLAVVGALLALGYGCDAISSVMPKLPPVCGRLEVISGRGISIFVDYAHTPDGLIKAQRSLRRIAPHRLITVFGCGGDRDRGKRPLMGKAVADFADIAIVTSDNPRTEEPGKIIEDILPGFAGCPKDFSYQVEPDRRKAIALAIGCAEKGDIVLIAGKGHEPYQEIMGIRHPFSDQAICKEALDRDLVDEPANM